ncbi:dipeptide ABC transporter ATP-binding protein [Arthrobacter ginkgonis]|uniref:Dipeptide ABC transporter ATP-binding protein n=1 Tax=Arthrobacter ginkgonis TaxID=1630594 RepID=A0ABP7D8J4_9MICC
MSHELLENAMDAGGARAERDRVLHARDVVVRYRTKRKHEVLAVDRVELELFRGETLGLVGESGSGKSSLGRSIAQLPSPTSGRVDFDGQDLTALRIKDLRPVRRNVQMIFQDPISSLNPRRTALDIVADPLRLMGHPDPKARALEVLAEVGVNEQMAARKPHELSGGQCQRISIARAFVQEPAVLICDEPVSALDVSVQAQVLNLLEQMKRDYGLSMIFISHDLAVVSNISDRVAVLYQGRMCEVAPSEGLYAQPRHHYTKLLLDSVPNPDVDPEVPGERVAQPKSLVSPSGCRFATRCPAATQECRDVVPELVELAPGHQVACHHPLP